MTANNSFLLQGFFFSPTLLGFHTCLAIRICYFLAFAWALPKLHLALDIEMPKAAIKLRLVPRKTFNKQDFYWKAIKKKERYFMTAKK